jgi:hypothetical protein
VRGVPPERSGPNLRSPECRVPIEVSRCRPHERALAPGVSDGRSEILEEFVDRYEPVVELDAAEHVVHSAGPVSDSLGQLATRLPIPA